MINVYDAHIIAMNTEYTDQIEDIVYKLGELFPEEVIVEYKEGKIIIAVDMEKNNDNSC